MQGKGMRGIIISFCLILMMFFTSVIHMSVISKNSREQELKTSLDNCITDTLENLFIHKSYDINNVDVLMTDFCTSFMLSQNANSNITVKLIDVDEQEGLIYIEVDSEFLFPNGKEKTISCRRMVILEEEI
jgi:hypothetical protein